MLYRVLVGQLLFIPISAHAHSVSGWIIGGALSPIVVIGLAIAIGYLKRKWSIGLLHVFLVTLWIALFWVASVYVTNDYIIWSPLVAYLLHVILMIWLIVKIVIKRR